MQDVRMKIIRDCHGNSSNQQEEDFSPANFTEI